jgi:hypothetical protein
MKTIKKTLLVLAALMLAATAAWAVDYGKMSTDELSAARGTLYNATPEEWNAFHTEWWKRLSQMSPEERQKYLGPGMGHGMGKGMGRGMGCCPCWAAPTTPGQGPAAATPAPPAGK